MIWPLHTEWPPEQDAFLIANPRAGLGWLATQVSAIGPKRSDRAVGQRRQTLGLPAIIPASVSDQEREYIRVHYLEKGESASIVGAALGRTRNSIIGIAHRAGFMRAPATLPRITLPYPQRVSNVARKRVRNASKPPPPTKEGRASFGAGPISGAVEPTIVVLDDPLRTDGRTITQGLKGCRWPIGGEGADTRFCCLPSDGMTYCTHHAARAYVQKTPAKEFLRGLRRFVA